MCITWGCFVPSFISILPSLHKKRYSQCVNSACLLDYVNTKNCQQLPQVGKYTMHAWTVYSFQSSFRYCTFTKMKGLISSEEIKQIGWGLGTILIGTVLSCEKTSESETDRSTWSWSTISQLSVLSFLLLFDHWIKSKAGPWTLA